MCLYLNASTFVTSDGDSRGKFLALLDNPNAGAHLAAEVKEARESGISMVMLHENDPARGGCASASSALARSVSSSRRPS